MIDKAYSNVLASLPLSVPRAAVMCDYLPYLRSITRDEQIRQAAKLKRRSVFLVTQGQCYASLVTQGQCYVMGYASSLTVETLIIGNEH